MKEPDIERHGRERPARREHFRWLGWFGIANALVLACVGLIYLGNFSWPDSALAQLYLVLVYVGHHVSLSMVPLLVLLTPLVVFRPRRKVVSGVAVAAASLIIAIYVLDGLLWSQSRFHLNALTAQILGWKSWVFAAVIFVIAITFESLLGSRIHEWIRGRGGRKGIWVGTGSVLALFSAWLIYAWADANYYVPVTAIAERLPVYKGFTAKRSLMRMGLVDLERARERDMARRVSGELASDEVRMLDYPAAPLQCANTEKYNLLIVMIDSWRFDMLSEARTPNIMAFARERGQIFQNHFSGGNASRSGAFSFFYGLPPGYWSSVEAVQSPAPLVEELQKQNYEIAVYSSGTLASPVELDRSAFSQVRDLHVAEPAKAPPWKRDQIMLDHWLDWLQARDDARPFFSFMFFDGVTGSQPPDDYPVRFEPRDEGEHAEQFAGYEAATHFVDSLVGQVFETLDQEGLTERTVILITSDHGEAFGETAAGLERHGSGYTRYQLQVPLVTAWPGKRAEAFEHRTSHYDITPTLFQDLLGCSNPPEDVSIGRNLFDEQEWQWLIAGSYFNYAIVEPDRLTITYPSGTFEVYDWNYRLIPDASVRQQVLLEVISANTRFYAQ